MIHPTYPASDVPAMAPLPSVLNRVWVPTLHVVQKHHEATVQHDTLAQRAQNIDETLVFFDDTRDWSSNLTTLVKQKYAIQARRLISILTERIMHVDLNEPFNWPIEATAIFNRDPQKALKIWVDEIPSRDRTIAARYQVIIYPREYAKRLFERFFEGLPNAERWIYIPSQLLVNIYYEAQTLKTTLEERANTDDVLCFFGVGIKPVWLSDSNSKVDSAYAISATELVNLLNARINWSDPYDHFNWTPEVFAMFQADPQRRLKIWIEDASEANTFNKPRVKVVIYPLEYAKLIWHGQAPGN